MSAVRCALMLLCLFPLAACAGAEVAESKAQETPAAVKKLPPRRAAHALVERPAAATPPPPTVPMPAIPQTAAPSGPAPISGCDPGGCWSGGARYNGGAGGTYLDKGGRLCQGNGTWMQCF